MNDDLTWAKVCVVALAVLILVPLCVLVQGWIIQFIWNAVGVPLFAWPQVTLTQGVLIGVGLAVVGSFFRSTWSSRK